MTSIGSPLVPFSSKTHYKIRATTFNTVPHTTSIKLWRTSPKKWMSWIAQWFSKTPATSRPRSHEYCLRNNIYNIIWNFNWGFTLNRLQLHYQAPKLIQKIKIPRLRASRIRQISSSLWRFQELRFYTCIFSDTMVPVSNHVHAGYNNKRQTNQFYLT